jgi:hypothetical protein
LNGKIERKFQGGKKCNWGWENGKLFFAHFEKNKKEGKEKTRGFFSPRGGRGKIYFLFLKSPFGEKWR